MLAGRLKYRLELQKPAPAPDDGFGPGDMAFVPVGIVAAERVRLSGRRADEVGEAFADYAARYNIRDAHRVDEHWRVRELGGHLYTVVAVEPNRDRGMLTLVCERVNE